MRRVINKNLSEREILRATELLTAEGVEALKLYVICPCQRRRSTTSTVSSISPARSGRASWRADSQKVGRILVSINPFVPKPWTPFQWEPMAPLADLKRKLAAPCAARCRPCPRSRSRPKARARPTCRRCSHVAIGASPRSWRLCTPPDDWWATLKRLRAGDGIDPDRFVHRAYDAAELLPWDFIDHQVDKRVLLAERRKAYGELQTPPCDTHTCHVCGACYGIAQRRRSRKRARLAHPHPMTYCERTPVRLRTLAAGLLLGIAVAGLPASARANTASAPSRSVVRRRGPGRAARLPGSARAGEPGHVRLQPAVRPLRLRADHPRLSLRRAGGGTARPAARLREPGCARDVHERSAAARAARRGHDGRAVRRQLDRRGRRLVRRRRLGLGPRRPRVGLGQTLALTGIPSGPYLIIPILGPNNGRDTAGYVVDFMFRPTTYLITPGGQVLISGFVNPGGELLFTMSSKAAPSWPKAWRRARPTVRRSRRSRPHRSTTMRRCGTPTTRTVPLSSGGAAPIVARSPAPSRC